MTQTHPEARAPRSAALQARHAQLAAARVIPVLRYDTAETAAYAAEVAISAGCRSIELTWTTPGVLDVLLELRRKHGDTIILGVGTVLNHTHAHDAVKAGADFLVSPGIVPDIVGLAHAADVLCLMGAFTPSEVIAARELKADVIKIFPADTGGPAHLKSLKSVFPDTTFCPTGGVTAQNMGDYFAAGAGMVGIGSNLYDKAAFTQRDTSALVEQIQKTLAAAVVSR